MSWSTETLLAPVLDADVPGVPGGEEGPKRLAIALAGVFDAPGGGHGDEQAQECAFPAAGGPQHLGVDHPFAGAHWVTVSTSAR
jgi:hypothetical protein